LAGTHFLDAGFNGQDLVSASGGIDVIFGGIALSRWILRGTGEKGLTDEATDWGAGGSIVIQAARR
jgi:hypothetical protein